MTTEEMIAVMQHYANGGAVQMKEDRSGTWVDVNTPLWCWGETQYRIKPAERKAREWWLITAADGDEVTVTDAWDAKPTIFDKKSYQSVVHVREVLSD